MSMELSSQILRMNTLLAQPGQRLTYVQGQLSKQRSRMDALNSEKATLLKAVAVIDKTIGIISANGISKIESIVTSGMQMVFDNPKVGLTVEKKETARGSNYVLLPYKDTPDGRVSGPAMETFGGGVVNVIAFLLRLVMMKRFKRAKLLVLDECFNNVAEKYLPRVSELLRKLAHDQGFNIFLVTHQPTLAEAADRVYSISGEPGLPPLLTLEKESRHAVS